MAIEVQAGLVSQMISQALICHITPNRPIVTPNRYNDSELWWDNLLKGQNLVMHKSVPHNGVGKQQTTCIFFNSLP